MSKPPEDRPMTPKEFENLDEPYCFLATVDPVSGELNYEYLEGWQWSGYADSIKEDSPERFCFFRMNKEAKRIRAKEYFGMTL